MVGHKAVDSVSGDLSPVTGVRINAENGTVVPVTLSSGAKKAKPPLGAVSYQLPQSIINEFSRVEFGISCSISLLN